MGTGLFHGHGLVSCVRVFWALVYFICAGLFHGHGFVSWACVCFVDTGHEFVSCARVCFMGTNLFHEHVVVS